jgi:Tfp pilus assembly protein PilO
MTHLQNHVRWFIRAQWTLGIFMAGLFGAFLIVAYRPYIARLHQLELNLSQCEYELRENQAKTKVLPAVAADVKHLKQQLDASKKLPPRQELPQFLKDVTALGQSCNLHPFTFKQGMPSRGDLFCEQPINLTFEGDFVDAFNFLRQTEQMQRLTRVRNMSIKTADAQTGRVEVQVSMNIYFAPE